MRFSGVKHLAQSPRFTPLQNADHIAVYLTIMPAHFSPLFKILIKKYTHTSKQQWNKLPLHVPIWKDHKDTRKKKKSKAKKKKKQVMK